MTKKRITKMVPEKVVSHIRCDACGRVFEIAEWKGVEVVFEGSDDSKYAHEVMSDYGDFYTPMNWVDVCDDCMDKYPMWGALATYDRDQLTL